MSSRPVARTEKTNYSDRIVFKLYWTLRCITPAQLANPLCTKTASGLNQAKCFIELWHPLFIMSLKA